MKDKKITFSTSILIQKAIWTNSLLLPAHKLESPSMMGFSWDNSEQHHSKFFHTMRNFVYLSHKHPIIQVHDLSLIDFLSSPINVRHLHIDHQWANKHLQLKDDFVDFHISAQRLESKRKAVPVEERTMNLSKQQK